MFTWIEYFYQGVFLFSLPRQPERTPVERVAKFYRSYQAPRLSGWKLVSRTAQNTLARLLRTVAVAFGISESPRGNREPYCGVLLWLLLLVSAWRPTARLFFMTVVGTVALEAFVWWYVPAYPLPLMPLVVAPWMSAIVTTSHGNRWARFLVVSVVCVILGQAVVWWWLPHYAGPVLPVVIATLTMAIQRVARSQPARRFQTLGTTLIVLLSIHGVAVGTLYWLAGNRMREPAPIDLERRAALVRQLQSQNRSHLVFVQYDLDVTLHREWGVQRCRSGHLARHLCPLPW